MALPAAVEAGADRQPVGHPHPVGLEARPVPLAAMVERQVASAALPAHPVGLVVTPVRPVGGASNQGSNPRTAAVCQPRR